MMAMGGFTRVFRENDDLLVFGGLWALREIPGPNGPKKMDPKKVEKLVDFFVFHCSFKKYAFVKNGAVFFRFRPLVHLIGAVRTEKTLPFSGQKHLDPKSIE